MLGLSRKDTGFLIAVIILTLATPIFLQPFRKPRALRSSMPAIRT